MKSFIGLFLILSLAVCGSAAPFSPVPALNNFGVGPAAWRFTSALSADASGTIEVVFKPVDAAERIIGQIAVRPFGSTQSTMPDLHILLSKAEVEGRKKLVLIIGYGIRSGTFVVDLSDLTSKSWIVDGTPLANPNGDHSLLVVGRDSVNLLTGEGVLGRLILRYH